MTANYASLRNVGDDLKPVAISATVPGFFRGVREPRLAPQGWMLKLRRAEFDRVFAAQLAKLDPQEIADSLGENAVLLCWEAAWTWCHRRAVAEWLEEALGIEVTELGFERAEVLAYKYLRE